VVYFMDGNKRELRSLGAPASRRPSLAFLKMRLPQKKGRTLIARPVVAVGSADA